MKALIDFIYSGEVTIKNENVMNLLAAFDYSQMGEVKQFCFEFLKSIVPSDNWFAIRSAADLYQDEHLHNQDRAIISKNFDTIVQTDEFKSLDKDQLCSIIQNRNHATKESIFSGLVVWIQVDESSRKNDFSAMFKELKELYETPVKVFRKICFERICSWREQTMLKSGD